MAMGMAMASAGRAPHREATRGKGKASAACRAVRARWKVQVRFGMRRKAAELVQEWAGDVAARADPKPARLELLAAAIGLPESHLEVEMQFGSLAELEQFWASAPTDAQADWARRFAEVAVDGTSSWSVLTEVAVNTAQSTAPPLNEAVQVGSASFDDDVAEAIAEAERMGGVVLDLNSSGDAPTPTGAAPTTPPPNQSTPSGGSLDGEPIVWSKGDRFPRVL